MHTSTLKKVEERDERIKKCEKDETRMWIFVAVCIVSAQHMIKPTV